MQRDVSIFLKPRYFIASNPRKHSELFFLVFLWRGYFSRKERKGIHESVNGLDF